MEKNNKAKIKKRLKDIKGDKSLAHEIKILKKWLALDEQQSTCKTDIKKLDDNLDKLAYEKYPTLSEADIKNIVIHLKWLPAIQSAVKTEMERVSQQLTGRIKELIARYETPMPVLLQEVRELEEKVNAHLQKMGFVWK